jgi:tight adherence protein B
MDLIFYAFAIVLFAALVLMIEGAWLWWSAHHGGEAQRIRQRLKMMSGAAGGAEHVSILKQRHYARNRQLDALLHLLPLSARLDHLLEQAGVAWSVARVLGVALALPAVGWLLLQSAPFELPLAAAAGVLLAMACAPFLAVLQARRARLRKIEEQLPETADFIARALRAGHSFSNVLQMVGAEMPEPIAGEFRAAHEEINYGVPMNEALYNLAERIPLTDLRYLVIAVLIQRESGGNLAEILANIGHIIRERLKLLGQVRVLSAEGRMSAWVLGALPFVVIAVLSVTNARYISVLWTDPRGVRLLWYAAGMLLLGIVWLRRVIHLRV